MSRHVVFVHGLWLHSDSWGSWAELFRSRGYEPHAPGWPGDGPTVDATRKAPVAVAGHGVDDIVAHYTKAIEALDSTPVVVGHSFGGLIAQRLLTEGTASAAVAIDAAPIRGVLFLPPSALRVASVALRNPANRKRTVELSPKQFHYAFGNLLSQADSDAVRDRYAIPGPGRPLFQAALANLTRQAVTTVDYSCATRAPLLLIAGGKDHISPASVTKATAKKYHGSGAVTELAEFPDRSHYTVGEGGWEEVADKALSWASAAVTPADPRA